MAQDMMDGLVPVTEAIVDVEKLYYELYADEPEFVDWPWTKLFVGRIKSLQKAVHRLQDAAKYDAAALAHDRLIHPTPTHAPNGMVLWEGSDAAKWLDVDFAAGKHLLLSMAELKASRPSYADFSQRRISKRLDQLKQNAKAFGATPGQSKGKVLPKGIKDRSRKQQLDPYVNDNELAEYEGVAV